MSFSFQDVADPDLLATLSLLPFNKTSPWSESEVHHDDPDRNHTVSVQC